MSAEPYDPNALTQAQIARATAEKTYGTGPSAGTVKNLFDTIPDNAWPYYKSRFPHTAKTVVFCPNRIMPYAESNGKFNDDSTLIQVYEGLPLYLDAVANALAASFKSNDPKIGIHAPALPPKDVDPALLKLFQECSRMWKEKRFDPPKVALAPPAKALANWLYRSAVVFAVMHEYGHAVLHRGSKLTRVDKELQADSWAANAFMAVFAHLQPLNVSLAGALLYMRAMAAREAILPQNKADLADPYPPSSQRFTAIIDVFKQQKQHFGYELEFFIRSTLTFALDMRLQALEHAIAQNAGMPPTQPEHFTSIIVAGLVQIFNGNMKENELEQELALILQAAKPDLIASTITICERIFSKQQRAYEALPDARRLIESSLPIVKLLSKAK